MKQFNYVKSKGVTLIEMLAAVAVFSITIGAISGLFISGIRSQRRVLATQEILDQTSYVLEYIGRAIRMARKDLTGTCLTALQTNYESNPPTNNSIKFIDYNGNCTTFYLDTATNQIKKTVGATTSELTSTKLQINSFKVNLSGKDQPPTDYLQPKVTIFLEISGRETGTGRPKIQIQTSISQRSLDVQY